MIVGIEIIFSLVAIIIGYIATCWYFQKNVEGKIQIKTMIPRTRSRIIYLVTAGAAFVFLIYMFATVYVNTTWIHQIKLLSLVAFLVPIAAIDFRTELIPNLFLLAAIVVRIVLLLIEFAISVDDAVAALKSGVIAAGILLLFFFLILLVVKNSIGMGDVKLFAVIGLYQGIWGAVNSVFFSLVASFFVSVVLLVLKKKTRKDTISFGPCIMLGVVFAIASSGI